MTEVRMGDCYALVRVPVVGPDQLAASGLHLICVGSSGYAPWLTVRVIHGYDLVQEPDSQHQGNGITFQLDGLIIVNN